MPIIHISRWEFYIPIALFHRSLTVDPLSDPLSDPLQDEWKRTHRTVWEWSQRHLHETADFLRSFLLHLVSDVGIGVQSKARGVVAQHTGEGFHIYTVLQG